MRVALRDGRDRTRSARSVRGEGGGEKAGGGGGVVVVSPLSSRCRNVGLFVERGS